jgi:DNA-binding winged helix-turn-helix (wHTH) protein/tetratricopeptide (TPR) repeat protein
LDHPRIDLAHEADFAIGALNVHPSTRELSRDGDRLVIEPRVMQVLVALHRAGGAVVSKDDLAHSCWEGRVVGEDAINRVISRLRRVGEGIAKDIFQIETVTRVGYRLVADGEPQLRDASPSPIGNSGIGRRAVMAGAGAAVLAAGGGWYFFRARPRMPSELAKLVDKADAALNYNTPEQNDAAVAIMREASRRFPDSAVAWGRLAIAYRQKILNSRRAEAASMMSLSQAAARRAVEIDPRNADGSVVLAVGNGLWYSNYLDFDRRSSRALNRFPGHDVARRARAGFLFETGRIRESIEVGERLVDAALPSPSVTSHAIKLWSAGRLDEADTLLDILIERWPRHFSVWASRYKFLLFSGDFKQAESMLSEIPVGLDDIDFEIWAAQTAALANRDAAKIDIALRLFDGIAPRIMSKAQEAASFASAAGRLDAAFGYLQTYYVSGQPIRTFRQMAAASGLPAHSGVMTFFLFEPPMKALRADPRFDSLTESLGLQHYWREAKRQPDYMTNLYKSS